MTTEVMLEAEQRWAPVAEPPYILTPDDAKNLRGTVRGKQGERVNHWKKLQPLFAPGVWQQVLAHLEGLED